jgi:hypothetical protein
MLDEVRDGCCRVRVEEDDLLLAPVGEKVVRKPIDREDALYRVRRDYNLRFGHPMPKAPKAFSVSFFAEELVIDGFKPFPEDKGNLPTPATCVRADHTHEPCAWDPIRKSELLSAGLIGHVWIGQPVALVPHDEKRKLVEELSKMVKEAAVKHDMKYPAPIPGGASFPMKYVDMILTVNKKPADDTLKITVLKERR